MSGRGIPKDCDHANREGEVDGKNLWTAPSIRSILFIWSAILEPGR